MSSRLATRLLCVAPRARVHACPHLRAPFNGVASVASASVSSAVRAPNRTATPRVPSQRRSFGATARRSFNATARKAAPFQFKLADIGEGITEVEIIKWYVTPGQEVEEFDALCEVQSDKSVVEITSPHSGKVAVLGPDAGAVLKVGQTLCTIDTNEPVSGQEEEPVPEPEPEAAPEPAQRREAAPPTPEPTPEPSGAKPKRAPKPHPLSDTAVRFEGEASVLPQAPPEVHEFPDSVEARRGGELGRRPIVKTSPAVRALAGRLGVELEDVKPSGAEGRVTREDVERHAGTASTPTPAAPAAAPKAAAPAPRAAAPAPTPTPAAASAPVDRGEATERMEMGRTRKVMYKAMGSMGDVPHFGYHHTLDLTNLLPYMKAANAQAGETKSYIANDVPPSLVRSAPMPVKQKTSVLAFLVKAMALALEEHPVMRSRVREEGEQRWLEVARDANIGIAVSDPKFGLLTPSLPAVDPSASVTSIASSLAALRTNAAKPGPLPHITVSSVGPLGESRNANPVLPPGGGLAIAAVGRAAWEVEWVLRNGGDKGGVWGLEPVDVEKAGTKAVLRCPVSWSGDHRVLEGAELIAFTETWKRYIEQPWLWVKV